jgi:hypothetical protein
MINNDVDYDWLIGTVMKIDSDTRECWVFIPKLMPAISEGTFRETNHSTNSGNIGIDESKISIDPTVAKANAIRCRAWDMEAPMPDIGSHVYIWVVDYNIRLRFWIKCNVQGDYKVIESERNPIQHHIMISGKDIPVRLNDSVYINLPDTLSAAVTQDGDTKTIDIGYAKDFKTSDEIRHAMKTVDYLMKYIKDKIIDGISTTAISDSLSSDALSSIKASAISAISAEEDMTEIERYESESKSRISALASMASSRISLVSYYAAQASIPSTARYSNSAAIESGYSEYASAIANSAYASVSTLADRYLSNTATECSVTEHRYADVVSVSASLFSSIDSSQENNNIFPVASISGPSVTYETLPKMVFLGWYQTPNYAGSPVSAVVSSCDVFGAYMGIESIGASINSSGSVTSLNVALRNDLGSSLSAYIYNASGTSVSSVSVANTACVISDVSAYYTASSVYGLCVTDGSNKAYLKLPQP